MLLFQVPHHENVSQGKEVNDIVRMFKRGGPFQFSMSYACELFNTRVANQFEL